MAQTSIPVDLLSPGQVFACLGLLEAADLLCGSAEGDFDWSDAPRFRLTTTGTINPVTAILEFLASVKVKAAAPCSWNPDHVESDDLDRIDNYPAGETDKMALPIVMRGANGISVCLTHWSDDSSRGSFKLYSGNRSALSIATAMLKGTTNKKGGELTKGVTQLWDEQREQLMANPFGILCAMGGSFNFDPRGTWTAIDAGYSPNEHKHKVMASPVVEMLAAWGLEHARPAAIATRQYCYAVWEEPLPPSLARAALGDCFATIKQRRFRFPLNLSGKNKVVCYAIEETTS